MFSPSNKLINFVTTDRSFVKMTSYCMNPNLALFLCAVVVLQSMINWLLILCA